MHVKYLSSVPDIQKMISANNNDDNNNSIISLLFSRRLCRSYPAASTPLLFITDLLGSNLSNPKTQVEILSRCFQYADLFLYTSGRKETDSITSFLHLSFKSALN